MAAGCLGEQLLTHQQTLLLLLVLVCQRLLLLLAAGLKKPSLVSACLDLVAASLAPPGPAPPAFKWTAWLGFRGREPRADVSPAAAAAPYFGKLDIWLLLPSFGALVPRLPSVPVMQSMGSGWG